MIARAMRLNAPAQGFRAVFVGHTELIASQSTSGRFHEESAPTSYMATSAETAWLEVQYRWQAEPDSYVLVEIEVWLHHVTDLTSPDVQSALQVTESQLVEADHTKCRSLARRLRAEGTEGVLTYSAAHRPDGRQLVVFLDNLRPESSVRVVSTGRITL